MDEPTNKQQRLKWPSPLLLTAIILILIGSLIASTFLMVLMQPGTEENLWTVLAIPGLITGGSLTFIGVVALIVNGALRGSAISEEVKGEQ